MAERLQKRVHLLFQPRRGLSALDHRRHHLMGVLPERRIGDELDERAHAEHVAPQAGRRRRFDLRRLILTVAEHGKPHGVE
jgi:hypothetical protein